MWIFLNDAFLSIVADRKNPARLLVRARKLGDIERVFPTAIVNVTPTADYLYRAFLPRADVAHAIVERLSKIDYPNFKDSVINPERHDDYFDVWLTMYRKQGLRRATDRGARHA